MRRVLVALAACVACQAPSAAPPSIPLTTPPLEVSAPVQECSVEGAACEASGAMCPVPGVCRAGACVPSRLDALASYPQPVSFGGDIAFSGPLREDGSAYVSHSSGSPGIRGLGVDEATAGLAVRLVSGRVGVGAGGRGQGSDLSALDLDTDTVLWTVTLGPGAAAWGGRGADTGQGSIAVAYEEGGSPKGGVLSFVRLIDGAVLRAQPYEGSAYGLASDEEGRVYLRTRVDTACHLEAFSASGEPDWTSEASCEHWQLVVHAGRLFDGANVRDTATGKVVFQLDPGFSVSLATDEVIAASTYKGILELRDPSTLERRLRQAGAGVPFAITSRGTVLTAARDSIYLGDSCASDCSEDTGEIREYTFDGRLVGMCEAYSALTTFLAGGVLWIGHTSAFDGYTAHPVPGYDLALHGWVTTYGTPGAQRRPR